MSPRVSRKIARLPAVWPRLLAMKESHQYLRWHGLVDGAGDSRMAPSNRRTHNEHSRLGQSSRSAVPPACALSCDERNESVPVSHSIHLILRSSGFRTQAYAQ